MFFLHIRKKYVQYFGFYIKKSEFCLLTEHISLTLHRKDKDKYNDKLLYKDFSWTCFLDIAVGSFSTV